MKTPRVRLAIEVADGVHPDDDPATPEARVAIARKLLAGSIRRYEEACEAWTLASDSYPNLDPPSQPRDSDDDAERKLWRRLLDQADEEFDSAELSLAGRIEGLFDMVSPPGRRACDDTAGYFVPRAVRAGGNVYVLAFSVNQYEPRQNIIAVYREAMTFDLESED